MMILKKIRKFRFLGYLALIGLLLIFAPEWIRKLIYSPSHQVSDGTLKELQFFRFGPITDFRNGSYTRGYAMFPENPKKIIVIFPGNSGQAADRIYIGKGLISQNAVVYLAEYPGFGSRPQNPNEKILFETALDDIRFLKEQFPNIPVVLIGESLGTGVASKVASQIPIESLILISPFSSLVDVAKSHYPLLPVGLLMPDRFDSVSYLKDLKNTSLLVVHGKKDKTVPFALGERLFQSYSGQKKFVALEGFGHSDLPWDNLDSELWREIKSFLK